MPVPSYLHIIKLACLADPLDGEILIANFIDAVRLMKDGLTVAVETWNFAD
jgi:hypothetical protein